MIQINSEKNRPEIASKNNSCEFSWYKLTHPVINLRLVAHSTAAVLF